MKKEKRINKRKTIILIMVLVLLILTIWFVINSSRNYDNENTTIIATKTTEEDNNTKIEYKIKIKQYSIQSIQKVITLPTKEQALSSYERYETINTYEDKGYVLELKGKKLIINMNEQTFKEEIEYDDNSNRLLVVNGEKTEIINQEAVKEALQNQGYTIK